MADTKTSALTELAVTQLKAADWFGVVDVSDTSMAASGTNKKVSLVDTGTWTPVITGSAANPTVTYSLQVGRYTRIGDLVFFLAYAAINTISGGSGDVRLSLPTTPVQGTYNAANVTGVAFIGAPISVLFEPRPTGAYGQFRALQNDGGSPILQISGLANGDLLSASGFYFV